MFRRYGILACALLAVTCIAFAQGGRGGGGAAAQTPPSLDELRAAECLAIAA